MTRTKKIHKIVNNKEIEINVSFKDIKNIYLKIDLNNSINISSPKNISEEELNDFIDENIENFLNRINLKEKFLNIEEMWFYLFGNKINYSVQGNFILFEDQKIKIIQNSIKKTIEKIYRKKLNEYTSLKQRIYENKMQIDEHSINIYSRKGIWGSNMVSKKKITYSLFLASFSREIIDYVIIHELAHNKYKNHNQDFKNFVNLFDPLWRLKRKNLKNKIYWW